MVRSLAIRSLVVAFAFGSTSSIVSAQLTPYSGFDASANAPGVNSIAARNAFIAATGGSVGLNFEGATPAGVTFTGGILRTGGTVRGGPCSLFGCNTTPGGNSFLDLNEFGATRFDFASPISFFGGFVGGQQLTGSSLRVFLSGGPQDIPITFSSTGGWGFYGFSSTETVSRVDVFIASDYVGIDDVIYPRGGISAVPEPSTYALMAVGLAALGIGARRRRTRA